MDVQTPRALASRSYGVGPSPAPPASAGSSAMKRCGPTVTSLRKEPEERTTTGCMPSMVGQPRPSVRHGDVARHVGEPLAVLRRQRNPVPLRRLASDRESGKEPDRAALEGADEWRGELQQHVVPACLARAADRLEVATLAGLHRDGDL